MATMVPKTQVPFRWFRFVACLILFEISTVWTQDECLNKLSDVASKEVLEEVTMDSSLSPRKYHLCNHTTYFAAEEDGDAPLIIFRPNVEILCGANGAVENNCTIVGAGAVALVAPPTFFDLAGNENDTDFLGDIRFEGITFQGGLVLATPARYFVRNCIFQDVNVVRSLVSIVDHRERLEEGESDTQAPSTTPSTTTSSAPTTEAVEETSDSPSVGPSAFTTSPTTTETTTSSPTISQTLTPTQADTMAPSDNTAAPTSADDVNNDDATTLTPTVKTMDEETTVPSTSPSQDDISDDIRHRSLQTTETTIDVLFNGCQFSDINIESDDGVGALIEVTGSGDVFVDLTVRRSRFEDIIISDSGDDSEPASTAIIVNNMGQVNLRSSCFLDNAADALVGENGGATTVLNNIYAADNIVTDCEGKAFYGDNSFGASEVEECESFNATVCSVEDADDDDDEEESEEATALPTLPPTQEMSLPPTGEPSLSFSFSPPPTLSPATPSVDTTTTENPSLRPSTRPTENPTAAPNVQAVPANRDSGDGGGGGLSTTILIVIIAAGAAGLLLCLVLLYCRCTNRSDIEYQSRY